VDFRILGPLEVVDESGPVELGGSNSRAVLAELLLHADRSVSASALIETVWGDAAPESAPAMLRNAISQLRHQAGVGIETTPSGYRLRLGSHTLDARLFAELVETGRRAQQAGAAAEASVAFGSAVSLWRGPALDGIGRNGEFDLRKRELEQLRLSATLDRIDADLAVGGKEGTIVNEIEHLAEDDPYNERLRAQQMTTLYRLGRQTDALAVYQQMRRLLAAELGLEPDERLRELERQILQHDVRLDSPRATRAAAGRSWRVAIGGTVAAVAIVSAVSVWLTRGGGGVQIVPASSLAVVDAATGRLASTTSLGGAPTAVAADATGSWTATQNRTVVRSSNDGRIVQTYGLGFAPVDIALHGRTVWLTSRGDQRQITRLHGGQLKSFVLSRRYEQAGGAGRELHVAADAGGAWVGDGGNGIYRLDGDRGRLVATAPDGLGAKHGGDLVVGSGSVWISDASHDGVVTRLDPVTGAELASITIAGDDGANGPATYGDGALWTVPRAGTTVLRVDAEANAITKTVELEVGTVGLAFADGALWAVNELDDTLRRVDPARAAVTRTWRFSRAPVGVAAFGTHVWVAFG
jgi:DNA-binding SARP family transcriptional activator